jgi:tRNA uridine 5-carboxymethylaminomethyl modification enzyme
VSTIRSTVRAESIVLTTGTFLRALMHCGEFKIPGGRIGEGPATGLSESLTGLGLTLGRLKTGTPPRLDRNSIRWEEIQRQEPDTEPEPFSLMTSSLADRPVIACWLTETNDEAHEIVRRNLDRAPLYSGQIHGQGPRYCPSFEDKVVRFPEKRSHHIFLEPEAAESDSVYCNGISTSLPPDVQEAFVHRIPGLRRARFLRYGYAVEYDFVFPHQLRPTLECKTVPGLYLAGQINGTSGYEEAAGQGIVAGINAARSVRGEEPITLDRSQAYIGVMIDDLTSKSELTEPYRMFTSMAEYRLILRADNAFRRLTPIGRRVGLVSRDYSDLVDRLEAGRAKALDALAASRVNGTSLEKILRRPGTTIEELRAIAPELAEHLSDRRLAQLVLTEVKYEGYLRRQMAQIERLRRTEKRRIPEGLDYHSVPHLRFEAREKLSRLRPYTIGQAGRISGISPADLQVLLVALDHRKRTT